MKIEFHATKDAANRKKHGVSLSFGARVFDDPAHLLIASIRPIDGEDRYRQSALSMGRLWTAVHVYRGNRVRFFSVRRSNSGEERTYRGTSG